MSEALPTASAQYNDMTGTAAVDWHSASDIQQLAASKGIDIKRYFSIGVAFSGVPPKSFTIYAVDKNVVGNDYDTIDAYARANEGRIPIVEFHFSAKWEEIAKYMKRLEVVLLTKMNSMKSFYTLDSEELD